MSPSQSEMWDSFLSFDGEEKSHFSEDYFEDVCTNCLKWNYGNMEQ